MIANLFRRPSHKHVGEPKHVERLTVCNGSKAPRDVSKISEAQARLQKLEEIVTLLVQTRKESTGAESHVLSSRLEARTSEDSNGQQAASTSASSQAALLNPKSTKRNGHLAIKGSEANYLGATHWATILENVCSEPTPGRQVLWLKV